jgi:hypothetical protein
MDRIYGNAAITIVASAARDTSEGILSVRKDPGLDSCAVRCTLGTGYDPEKFIGELRVQFYPYDIDDQQPLSSRAWAVQEYLRSPRVLSFHTDQLVWECDTKKIYANGPGNVERFRRTERRWENFGTQYTRCHMTYEDDRLDAFAGYAKARHAPPAYGTDRGIIHRDQYLAGLWFSRLRDHFLWYIEGKTPRLRPKSYRAPSWSWASVSGPVGYVTLGAMGSLTLGLDVKDVSVTTS